MNDKPYPVAPPLAHPILDAAIEAATQINKLDKAKAMAAPPPSRNEPPEFRFVSLADNLADTILQNAQNQLNKAESNLKLAEQMAEDIKAKSKRIWEILQEFEREMEDYGEATLEVHERFMRPKAGNSK